MLNKMALYMDMNGRNKQRRSLEFQHQQMLYRKYNNTLSVISIVNDTNMDDSWNILLHELDVYLGKNNKRHMYKGIPENFNWREFNKDITSIKNLRM